MYLFVDLIFLFFNNKLAILSKKTFISFNPIAIFILRTLNICITVSKKIFCLIVFWLRFDLKCTFFIFDDFLFSSELCFNNILTLCLETFWFFAFILYFIFIWVKYISFVFYIYIIFNTQTFHLKADKTDDFISKL